MSGLPVAMGIDLNDDTPKTLSVFIASPYPLRRTGEGL
jgi:hypothetical protein